MAYAVSTPVFEGPFDLLLHLVNREEVDIHEISLSGIIEGFVAEVERMGKTDLDLSSEFLLIAAILVELKTRRLLPRPDGVEIDEDVALWEARDLLIARLLECKTFKDAARRLAALSDTAGRSVPRRCGPDERFADLTPDPLAGVTAERLRRAFLKAMTPRPVPRVDLSHVAAIKVSVTDTVEALLHDLPRAGRITFRRLTGQLADRIDVVIHFLALLELYKQSLVDLQQGETFGELVIVWVGGVLDEAALATASIDSYEG
jgi:segregation and condensation protein A